MEEIILTTDDHLSYIKISGPDADSFLQGQLTVDIKAMKLRPLRYCAQCDTKGKMVGLGFLFYHNNNYFFIQSSASIENSLSQFKKFSVFSQVEFTSSDMDKVKIVLEDAEPVDEHTMLFQTPPIEILKHKRLVAYETASGKTANSDIDAQANVSLSFIQCGVAVLKTGMAEQWIPQMLNVQALDGIDFDKGCYMGQETVARTRYLGKNKRALFTATLKANNLQAKKVESGHAVYLRMGEHWRKSGTVVNVAQQDDTVWLSIVLPNDVLPNDVLTNDMGSEQRIALDDNGEISLQLHPLPYVIQSETSSIKKTKRHD
jgi:folate-binding protein YgfZ